MAAERNNVREALQRMAARYKRFHEVGLHLHGEDASRIFDPPSDPELKTWREDVGYELDDNHLFSLHSGRWARFAPFLNIDKEKPTRVYGDVSGDDYELKWSECFFTKMYSQYLCHQQLLLTLDEDEASAGRFCELFPKWLEQVYQHRNEPDPAPGTDFIFVPLEEIYMSVNEETIEPVVPVSAVIALVLPADAPEALKLAQERLANAWDLYERLYHFVHNRRAQIEAVAQSAQVFCQKRVWRAQDIRDMVHVFANVRAQHGAAPMSEEEEREQLFENMISGEHMQMLTRYSALRRKRR